MGKGRRRDVNKIYVEEEMGIGEMEKERWGRGGMGKRRDGKRKDGEEEGWGRDMEMRRGEIG